MALLLFRVAVTTLAVSVALGCTPIDKVDQGDFCFANYAFEANITSVKQADEYSNYEYTIDIKKDYKKNKAIDTIQIISGFGPSHSCGPQILDIGTSYLIYAKDLRIITYKSMANVVGTDIERITTKYDCTCTIKFDFDKYIQMQTISLPPTTTDECNAPLDYCRRSGYCKRDQGGGCTWGNLGVCN
ncbi:uncharacterized protein LOC125669116 [Ostrea edulis]|uniref:uncharacterized protein LOC125669116 n=1 Tax=Ostrea edulis TaxID=37623 RepID=UPI0024AED92F|nr:uncharacterized protein LOC125669116 [Ostrea edulis]